MCCVAYLVAGAARVQQSAVRNRGQVALDHVGDVRACGHDAQRVVGAPCRYAQLALTQVECA
mgnify:CR=1 FL=1